MNRISINYFVVIACEIVLILIGEIWYGPLFSKLWIKQHNLNKEQLKKDFNPAKTFGLSTLVHMVMAIVFAYLLSLTNAQKILDALRVSIFCWMGFTATKMFVNRLFSKTSLTLFYIDSGNQLVNSILFGVIIILWK